MTSGTQPARKGSADDRPSPRIRQYRTAGKRDDSSRYASIDSAPPAYSVPRSPRTAPIFLITFGMVSLGLLLLHPVATDILASALGPPGRPSTPIAPFSYAVGVFFVAFFVAYAALASGAPWRRARFALVVVVIFLFLAIIIELIRRAIVGPDNAEVIGGLANLGMAYCGMALLSLAILATHRLPEPVSVPTVVDRSPRYAITLLSTAVVAGGVSILAIRGVAELMGTLRDLALLGGILPGIVLFRLALNVQWFVLARIELRRRRVADLHASVAFIVPAYNEEENVAACIHRIDQAAEHHPGRTRVYVVDNGSSDGTADRARVALMACRTVSGSVLDCPQAGKAHALNLGLAAVNEDIVIRVDADTLVEPDVLPRVLGHFADPDVGAVGGVPIPKEMGSVFAPLRLIEVFDRIGFVRVATNAIDAVMVVPGTFAAYRRDLLHRLGGFVTGTNGEDTDMTIRVGRMGFRVVTDPAIRVRSEVPASLRHLREQRIRWSRSMYHVLAQHVSAISMRQGPRGVAMIPWTLVHLPRQSMLLPLLVFGAAVAVVERMLLPLHGMLLPLHGGAAILAIILGLQLIVTVVILAANRRLDLAQYLPDYIGFRLLRSYFALESLFTLTIGAAVEVAPATVPAAPRRRQASQASPTLQRVDDR
jgi:cellulose synthase/poly-beta-1,6-N-acetylglucosamine synthase-like glycosyltransferase